MHAIFVEDSNNAKVRGKIGKVSATYSAIETSCPRSCELYKDKSCYAMSGHVRYVLARFSPKGTTTALDTAKEEARKIDEAFKGGPVPQDGARGGRDLRLHVSGDARTIPAAKALAAAVGRWLARGGGAVWAYTHAHKAVPREAWGDTSVLASIDNLEQLPGVLAQGYAPARYVAEFPDNKTWEEGGIRWQACPAQTKDISCTDCRLCFNDRRLFADRRGIAFSAHGAKKNALKRRLTVLSQDGSACGTNQG